MAQMGGLRQAFLNQASDASSRHGPLGVDFSRRSPMLRSGKEGAQLCSALPIAAEIQAILKGSPALSDPDSDKSCIFGCSPPPRDCTNALVRDSSFSSMRAARLAGSAEGGPSGSGGSTCSTAFFQSHGMSCISPAASAFSTA